MTHTRVRFSQAVLMAAMLLAAPAAMAQKVGHYQGTNNEGDEIDVYVANVGGSLVISSLDDSGTVICTGGVTAGYGVGFGGFNTPITDGDATFDYLSTNVYYDGTFKFKGKNVSGKARFGVPLYTTTAEPPKKASSCLTAPQTYTASFVGTESAPPSYHRAMTWPLVTK